MATIYLFFNTKSGSKSFESLSAKKSRSVVAERSYFDTYSFISELEQNGFNRQQAEKMCYLFKEIVNYVSQDIKKECVTKSGQVEDILLSLNSIKRIIFKCKFTFFSRNWQFNKS